MVALALLGLRSLRNYDFSGAGPGSVFDASVAGSDRVWDALLEAVFADLMAESPKPPVEGRGARSPERDGDPDPLREASGSADERGDGCDTTVTASAQLPELDQSSLVALGDVGRRWDGCMPAREIWERALITGAAESVGSYRVQGRRWIVAAGGSSSSGP
jgi:hypothetical protein